MAAKFNPDAKRLAAPLLHDDALGGDVAVGACLGVLAEGPSERRVSMTPEVAQALIGDGYTLLVEAGAGLRASFTDAAYEAAGCKIAQRKEVLQKSGVLLRIDAPVEDFAELKGKIVISWVARLLEAGRGLVRQAAPAGVTLVDVTAVPRITIAQKLDVLSSQAKVAGHRAVLEAAHNFGRFHQSEMTAAGKFPPSQTFILGCGVAGLAAIGTSRALGSVVRAWDVRDVRDQVESMGGRWVTVNFEEDATGTGGYAKESSQEFQRVQRETFTGHLRECDIAITTAAIPGRKSPLLITEEMVGVMKPGSVIVDLAAAGGGNCALTRAGECYTTANGVTIVGFTDMPARMAAQSSAMYAQNMMQLLRHVHGTHKAAGLTSELYRHLDQGDEGGDIVVRSIVTCAAGQEVKAPPLPAAKPAAKPQAPPAKAAGAAREERPLRDALVLATVISALVLLVLVMGEGAPVTVIRSFLLAGAAGYQAVWGVAHALHTPLMSVTNAISGMTVVGGMHLFMAAQEPTAKALGALATAVSSVNIMGGFVVTQRMLNLFKRPGDVDYSATMALPGLVLAGWSLVHPETSQVSATISSCLCIASIACLATMRSANLGCKFGMVGVGCALVSAFRALPDSAAWAQLGACAAVGGVLGLFMGWRVSPIALPQTVAAFHSLVGLAAMVTSVGVFYAKPERGLNVVNVSALLGDFIGGITLTGSIVAFGKLNGNLSSKALSLPGKNWLNLFGFLAFLGLGAFLVLQGDGFAGKVTLWVVAALACLMGLHLVASVGGGDMPVCVTVLNSYSGWALAAEGFNLDVPMLAIVGSIIGFSGAILTKIMCDAMNRDILNVIFGGMNVAAPAKGAGDEQPKEHVEASVAGVAEMLAGAKEVLVVPGYGMAVARAQNAVGEVARALREAGVRCTFAIHPVAGRMPGQMNVLLAEAGVPYDWVKEMDECNPDMEKVDVCVVMGANDITNSAAQEVEGCPIWGMPVIEVWRAKKTIFCKRSMRGGYADLDNPVFYKENTMMLLGDAAKTASELATRLKEQLKMV